ncbi:glutamate-gated chloride channel [Trichonephila inaurata madagascariensis]|uniref:Glutamate-gated chloride channel n=1 Tax=Trichonephila inaurata madagascariensis TaxID=2747483 RepID=A0A8X6Y158_9ARAC|nr:glutamate-gated chloride channel [Trichonephila inaurata madagascariensis]
MHDGVPTTALQNVWLMHDGIPATAHQNVWLMQDGVPATALQNVWLMHDREYSVQMTLREQWRDERMQFDDQNGQVRYLTLTDPDKIWKPDLFFSNEKEGHFHNIIMPNVLLRIYPNGDVLYSIRISLVLSCPMDLKYYPLDKQTCSITMVSYGYTTEDLVFLWKKDEPVQLVKTLHLPRFTLEAFLTDYCASRTNTGINNLFVVWRVQLFESGPAVQAGVQLLLDSNLHPMLHAGHRQLGVFLVGPECYPSSSFTWSDNFAHHGHPDLWDQCFFATSLLHKNIWTGVCLTFVFRGFAGVRSGELCFEERGSQEAGQTTQVGSREGGSTRGRKDRRCDDHLRNGYGSNSSKALYKSDISTDLVHFQVHLKWTMRYKPLVQPGDLNSMATKFRDCEIHMPEEEKHRGYFLCGKWWFSRFPTRSKRIDVISRIFFPLAFAFFNLLYWTTYLLREDKDE